MLSNRPKHKESRDTKEGGQKPEIETTRQMSTRLKKIFFFLRVVLVASVCFAWHKKELICSFSFGGVLNVCWLVEGK